MDGRRAAENEGAGPSGVRFRNRRGEEMELPAFRATAAKNAFGRVLDAAVRRGGVVITKHDDPKAVLLSWDEFEALTADRSAQLRELSAEFDAQFDRMQTSRARRAMRAVFDASPAELGRAAVKAARKRKRG